MQYAPYAVSRVIVMFPALGFHSYVRTDGDDGDGQGSQVAPARVARSSDRVVNIAIFNAFFLLTNEQQPQAVEARATGTKALGSP